MFLLLGLVASLLPAIPLWFGNREAWDDVQPEFITDEWKECVSAIQKTIEKLDRKHKNTYKFKYPLFINLPLLCIYHTHHNNHNEFFLQESESTDSLNIALRYMRFASAAYGAVYMRFLKIIKELPLSSQNDMDIQAISQHTGVFIEDIIDVKLTGIKVACPCYYIAVDRATKAVVVTVRGTANFADVITDLVCESVRFLNGHAHDGIRRGSERLFEATIKTVCELLDKNPSYSLIVTGHSLGAGTSILLTMLYLAFQQGELDEFAQDMPNKAGDCILRKNAKIKCYAFAPPPVFSAQDEHNKSYDDAIEVYVNHRDIVPRLSLATFNDMIHALQKIDSLRLGVKERLKAALSDINNPVILNVVSMIRSALEDTEFARILASNDSHFVRLHIPGRIHLLQRKPNKEYRALKKNREFFKRMLLAEGFFADHLPDQYELALTSICQVK